MLKSVTFLLTTVLSCSLSGTYSMLRKQNISINTKKDKIVVSSFNETVEEILNENNIKYDEDDIITPSLNTKLQNDMEIDIVEVRKETKNHYEKIDYETKIIEDKNILKGQTKIHQQGKKGENQKTYEYIYKNDELVKTTLIDEKVTKVPVEEIIKKGTKEIEVKKEEVVAVNNEKNNLQNAKKITVESTAYAGHTITSTGTKPKWGTIAVDPKIIPYGTKVYIPEFNKTFTAEDCGGAIKGNMIDIFMHSSSDAYKWGRRNIEIFVISKN